ncbi:MAG: hypothetical protein MN733_30220 [Nitrososphaera sp.]|nr:hypothetical protein [Nitrososphaera sp.]
MFINKKTRNRRVSPKFAHYERLQAFREAWLAKGGTRAGLRQARRAAKTLYPTADPT